MEKPVEIKTPVVTVTVGGEILFQTYNGQAQHRGISDHLLIAQQALKQAQDMLAGSMEGQALRMSEAGCRPAMSQENSAYTSDSAKGYPTHSSE